MSRKIVLIIFASAYLTSFTDGSSEELPPDWDDYWEDHWEEFDELVQTGAYIDKSPLLKWFIEKRRHIALVAPPKLGRTTNQLMMRRFFEVPILPLDEDGKPTIKQPEKWNETVFNDLAICKDKQFCNTHFQKYPVIYLDLGDLNTTTDLSFFHSIRYLSTYMFEDHDYLRNSKFLSEKEYDKFIKYRHPRGGCEMPDDFVATGGWLLSVWLQKHFNNTCIVLIDNFDSPGECLINKTGVERKMLLKRIRPIQDFVVKLVRGNDRVHHSMFITRRRIDDYLTKEMTSLVYQSLFETPELIPYYGFSEADVKGVVTKFKRNSQYKKIMAGLDKHKTVNGETVYSAFSMHDWCEDEEKAEKKRLKKEREKVEKEKAEKEKKGRWRWRRDVGQAPRTNDWVTFEDVVRSGGYVDKSGLITYFILQRKHIVVLAPRRFGKSLNMEMLRKFVELHVNEKGEDLTDRTAGNFSIFNELAVCNAKDFCKTHYAAYPVVYIDFHELDITDEPAFYNSFRKVIHNLFVQHDYLKNSKALDEDDLEQFNDYRHPKPPMSDEHVAYGPYVLSRLLSTHFDRSCMVFVDNFDTPALMLMEEMNIKFRNGVLRALNGLVKDVSKSHFVNHSLSSALDFMAPRNLPHLVYVPTLDDKGMNEFYGFKETEIKDLLIKFNATNRLDEAKKLFDGGYKNLDGEKVYRAFSIVKFLAGGHSDQADGGRKETVSGRKTEVEYYVDNMG